jgi:DNA-binding ferritin-like protein (Dps family)
MINIKEQKQKIQDLPETFTCSDKQMLSYMVDLFEMIKDNHQLIQILGKKIDLLELKLKN